jgi:hypothetical protein
MVNMDAEGVLGAEDLRGWKEFRKELQILSVAGMVIPAVVFNVGVAFVKNGDRLALNRLLTFSRPKKTIAATVSGLLMGPFVARELGNGAESRWAKKVIVAPTTLGAETRLWLTMARPELTELLPLKQRRKVFELTLTDQGRLGHWNWDAKKHSLLPVPSVEEIFNPGPKVAVKDSA